MTHRLLNKLAGNAPLSRADVAELCGVSEITVREWELQGKFVPEQVLPSRRRIYSFNKLQNILRGALSAGLGEVLAKRPKPGPTSERARNRYTAGKEATLSVESRLIPAT